MKKKISLYMALIMLINVFGPFSTPLEVKGAGKAILALEEGADGRHLVTGTNQRQPMLVNDPVPDGQISLRWDIDFNSANDMYVLRYYDTIGEDSTVDKIEMTIQEDRNGFLYVNYDVYERIMPGSSYENYNYPQDSIGALDYTGVGIGAADSALGYFVNTGADGFERIADYFKKDRNGGIYGQGANVSEDLKSRVNNRDKYTFDDTTSPTDVTWSPLNPFSYPPSIDNDIVDLPKIDYLGTTASSVKYLYRLSPSFNILSTSAAGDGYSFEYKERRVHFLYQPTGADKGTFFLTIDEVEKSRIYDFRLEYYSGTTAVRNYDPTTSTNKNGSVINTNGSAYYDTFYYHTGVDPAKFNVIPIAQTIDTTNTVDPLNITDNTLDDFKPKEDTPLMHNSFVYDRSPLDLSDDNKFNDGVTNLAPAMPPVGLDIRFDMPLMYDEASGKYDLLPASNDFPMEFDINLNFSSNSNNKNFEVKIDKAQDLAFYDGTDDASDRVSNIASPYTSFAPPYPSGLTLYEATILEKTDGSTSQRVRVRVDGLEAGVIYRDVTIDMVRKPVNDILRNTGRFASYMSVLGPGSSRVPATLIYTFPKYKIDYREGVPYITITPFDRSVDRSGFYYLQPIAVGGGELSRIKTPYNTSSNTITFPVGANPSGWAYQILFSRNDLDVVANTNEPVYKSQIFVFTPMATEAEVSAPKNFEIFAPAPPPTPANEPYLIPKVDADPQLSEADLYFTTQWEIGRVDHIDEILRRSPNNTIEIYYDLELASGDGENYLIPPRADNNPFERIKVTVTSVSSLQVKYESLDASGFIINEGEAQGLLQRPVMPITNPRTDVFYVSIPFKVNAKQEGTGPSSDVDFFYPNVYFMRAVLKGWTEKPQAGDINSQFDSITLDNLTALAVPPPVNLDITDVTADSMRIGYDIPIKAIKAYMNSLYRFDPEITVNVYIGQFEEVIKNRFYGSVANAVPIGTRKAESFQLPYAPLIPATVTLSGSALRVLRGLDAAAYPAGVVRIAEIPISGPLAIMPDVTSNRSTVIANTVAMVNAATPLDKRVEFSLQGLDENQRYYLFTDLTVTKHNVVLPAGEDPAETSELSALVPVITPGEENKPTPLESGPPAPSNVQVQLVEGNEQNSAQVTWSKLLVPEENSANIRSSRIEYEVIRLENEEMADAHLRPAQPDDPVDSNLKRFFAEKLAAYKTKIGWQTEGVNGIKKFDGNFNEMPDASGRDTTYDASDDPINMTDNTLSPNKIYFYYVRAVKKVVVYDEQLGRDITKILVSSWNRAAVTTSPVQAPADLRKEQSHPSHPNYDPMTEVIVSWESTLKKERLGSEFNFRYEMREYNDETETWSEWKTTTCDVRQWNDAKMYALDERTGITRYYYKVSGLKQRTAYEMRVHLFDVAMNDKSLNTNMLPFITDGDPGEIGKEKEVDEWEEYLRKKLEELLGGQYWITFESPGMLSVVVRPGNAYNALPLGTADAAMTLYNNDADSVTYYIPASVMVRANASEKGFKLPYTDLDILTAPRMLNESVNDTIVDMSRFIREDEISDYFVRMTVNRAEVSEMIENNPPLSKETRIALDAIGTVPAIKDITSWDTSMFDKSVKLVEDKIKDPALRQAIRNMVDRETRTEEMMRYLDSLVLGVRNELMRDVHSSLRVGSGANGIFSARHQLPFETYDAAMFLVAKGLPEYSSVNGYSHINGAWVNQPVTDYYNGKAITTRRPGTFIFSGREVNIPGIENVPRGGNISAFTAKYGLEDYLGYDGVDLTQTATRYMVAGSVARMAGAPHDADPIAWIGGNLNMNPSSRNTNGNVQVQEAAAMVMALYEKKTGTAINKMTIRNYQATAKMTGLDDRYTQAVRAGFETAVLTDTNMRPADAITIRNLLDMLAALDAKVKL